MTLKNCPCGHNTTYENCCKKIHNDITLAKTAEGLMRSRYTAFTMANVDYLIKSWSKKTVNASAKAKKELKQWAQSVTWVKLVIIGSNLGQENDTEGTVEFKAFYYEKGRLENIHENSFFIKNNNHWVYVSENK